MIARSLGLGIRDWLTKSATEQAFYRGHFRQHPPGSPRLEYLMATLIAMLANNDMIGGMKKVPAGSADAKPDPNLFTATDFAPWLIGTAYGPSNNERDWTESDDRQARGARMLGIIAQAQGMLEKTNGNAS